MKPMNLTLDKLNKCKLCLRYNQPNAETIKVFKETDKKINFSKIMSGPDALAIFDKEFLDK